MAVKGVIIEYDFTAMNGAEQVFRATRKFLKDLDNIAFDDQAEARYLAGRAYADGLARYFSVVKTKKTAPKAGRDIVPVLCKALAAAVPQSITPGFRNFVKTLTDKNVRVVIMTSTDYTSEAISTAFAPILSDLVTLCRVPSLAYGGATSEVWRHACAAQDLSPRNTLVVTGSGVGVRSALMAGVASIAVVNARVAYQDFSGADAIARELGAPLAKKALEILRVS